MSSAPTCSSIALGSPRSVAQKGDAVLLAPATSSYDQFKNYIERGNHFRALVNAMREEKA